MTHEYREGMRVEVYDPDDGIWYLGEVDSVGDDWIMVRVPNVTLHNLPLVLGIPLLETDRFLRLR